MKKGYYIHFGGRQSIGVSKKIDWQLEEFRKHYEIEELEVMDIPRSLPRRVAGLFPADSIARDYAGALEKIKDPDFLYVRRTTCDRQYIEFFKEIKKRYPQCKIIVEIFVYPYDKDDFGKWNAWPFVFKEWIYRPRLKKYLDRFVTYSEDTEIFGIKTIVTTNGIIVDSVRMLGGDNVPGKIRMIGVAYMQRQHGYERVMKGMADYYAKYGDSAPYDISLKLVGDGPEKAKYLRTAEELKLGDHVTFYGTTKGDALDDLYDDSDIALGIFGEYKVKYYGSTGAIKTRECLAKGIPLTCGVKITGVRDDFKYLELFDNDASPVSMEKVIDLYKRSYESGESRQKMSESMREYAREHVSMEVVMKPIIDFIDQGRQI